MTKGIIARTILFATLFHLLSHNTNAQTAPISLTLNEVIEIAKENSPEAMVAKHMFMASHWQFTSYRAQYLPSLNLSANIGSYNRSLMPLQNSETGEINYIVNNNLRNSLVLSVDQNIPLTGGVISIFSSINRLDQFSPNRQMTYNSQPINITYLQPLHGYNSLRWEKKIEPKRYEIAKREYLEQLEKISIETINLFFEVLSSQMALESATKNLENTKSIYMLAKERYNLATVSKDQLLQLELRMLNDQLAISDNQLNLESKLLKIKSYLGYKENIEITFVPPSSGPDVILDFDKVYGLASENSSFVPTKELDITEAERSISKAKSEVGLQARLTATFGLTQQGKALSGAYKNPMDQEIIGVSLSMPIIDWGLSRGKIKLAKSRAEVIKTQTERDFFEHRQNIMIQVLQFNKQTQQCLVSKRANEIASERYEITRERFIAGKLSVIELNTAQSEKDQAMTRYIDDLSNHWKYYYSIRKIALFDFIEEKSLSANYDALIQ